ncbi:MAG: NAD(P)H-binding protein [Henriciella sp.]
MSGRVVILGAKGRFGRSASQAFHKAGWKVRVFARNWSDAAFGDAFDYCEGDALQPEEVIRAAAGCDVIVNALHPRYENWKRELPQLSASVIAAAKQSGAAIMIAGNIYNYGEGMPPVLTEDTPHTPTTRKGKLREEMEETYARAADEGVKTIILRAGDFIEREKTGNWFDTYITPKTNRGKITYPGPLDRVHAWAYLPDMARALADIADKAAELGSFSTFVYEGFNLTGTEFVALIQHLQGRTLKVSKMPWPIMSLLGVFVPTIREVMEMRYLWQVSHAIDGTNLRQFIPEFRPTPVEIALKEALGLGPDLQPALPRPVSATLDVTKRVVV